MAKAQKLNGVVETSQLTPNQREMLSDLVDLIKDCVGQQMRRRRNFSEDEVKNLLGDYRSPNPAASRLLRQVTTKLEDENEELFSQMCVRLQITQSTVYGTFVGVVRELFESGVNWGRIVALVAFCEALVVHCARSGMEEKAKLVIQWTALYMAKNLSEWMKDHGEWVCGVKSQTCVFMGTKDSGVNIASCVINGRSAECQLSFSRRCHHLSDIYMVPIRGCLL
jgi:hypothetical protein